MLNFFIKYTKKFLCIIACFLLLYNPAQADFAQHYSAGQEYLSQFQYSSAIDEFKKALKINYMDDSARIGLANSYLARGTYYANTDKNWAGAADDYRAALFYLKYYPDNQDVQNSMQVISNATQNLNQILQVQKFDTSAKSRYEKAKELRFNGAFAAAAYEFVQSTTDPNLRKDAYGQVADIIKLMDNYPKSIEYYKKALESGADDPSLRFRYAIALDKSGKPDAAVQEYNYVLASGSDDPEIMYALERIYKKKLDQNPNDAATITSLGAILQKQNKLEEALQYYTKAGELDPSNVTTRLNIGTLYQQKKSYDAAIAAYESILTLYPDNIQANLYKAQCLVAMGQNDQANAAFKKVISLDPTNKDIKAQIYDSFKSSMSPSDFLAFLGQKALSDKNAIDYMYNYSIDLHKQNKFDEAIAGYREVLKYKNDNPEVYLNLAIAYKQKQDNVTAKQILQDAKIKFPTNKQIADNLNAINQEAIAVKFDEASQAYNCGDYQKALAAYQSVQPPDFDSLSGIGACYKGLNNDAKAIEYYKKAIELKPNSDVAYYIGVLYSEKEDWANSKIYLKKAIALNAANTKAKDLLGTVIEQMNIKLVDDAIALYEKGDYIKATTIFDKVLQDEPKNAYAHYYKGLILDTEKKYQLALSEYQKAIKSNPDLGIIYYLMALDYDSLTQFKNSLINYKKYVAATAEDSEYKKYAQSRIKELKKYEGT